MEVREKKDEPIDLKKKKKYLLEGVAKGSKYSVIRNARVKICRPWRGPEFVKSENCIKIIEIKTEIEVSRGKLRKQISNGSPLSLPNYNFIRA